MTEYKIVMIYNTKKESHIVEFEHEKDLISYVKCLKSIYNCHIEIYRKEWVQQWII